MARVIRTRVTMALLVLLALVRRHRRFSGQIFVAFTMGYAVLRYLVEGLRADTQRGSIGPVSTSVLAQEILPVIREYPRHTPERILLDPSCYEGEATDRVLPPTPLGKMGRKLQELWAMPVEQRPLDLYVALAEVAR